MPATERNETAPRTVVENIETILSLENAALRSRTPADSFRRHRLLRRLADLRAGACGLVSAWAVVNAGLISFIPAFDPYPFQLLCMIVSLEGVLLSTFVLIKQNRMSYLSDRRNHLDLQINMLSEREVTRLLVVTDRIARPSAWRPSRPTSRHAELSRIRDRQADGRDRREAVRGILKPCSRSRRLGALGRGRPLERRRQHGARLRATR